MALATHILRLVPALLLAVATVTSVTGQSTPTAAASAEPVDGGPGPVIRFLTPADTFSPRRFWTSAGAVGATATGFGIGLWHAWYKDYDLGAFRTFDDRGEWLAMDKLGHTYTAYHYSRWAHHALRWSGNPEGRSLAIGVGVSVALQSTIEVMDGFSEQWGFSWADMGANLGGAGLFAAQQLAFGEQRVQVKFSSWRVPYPTDPILPRDGEGPTSSVVDRAREQFGTTPWQRFVKDYNGQTLWLSTNPWVLAGADEPRLPWLNLSFGYSAHNVLGAFGNGWRRGEEVYVPPVGFARQREYLLSLDVDLERLPVRNRALRTVLLLANHFKIPAPALLFREGDPVRWRWLYY